MNGPAVRVVVVGGGLAGLASACELARRGCDVTIVERNEHLGGKMNVLSEGGYTFDMGPTILTIPDVLRGILTRAGRRVEDYIDLRPCVPQWRGMYEDGTVLDLDGDPAAFAARLDRQFPGTGAGAGYTKFLSFARRMYGLSEKVFFYKDVESPLDMMRASPVGDPGLLRDVLGMRMHSTVGATVEGMIPEPHARQMCEHFLQYVGSSPFLAPAILSLIAAAQADHGCWYAMGGTRMVARALGRLAGELGVRVMRGRGVKAIDHDGARVVGVVLDDGERIEADAVVSNCDVQRTLTGLVGTEAARAARAKVTSRYTPACSGVVLYLGLSRRYEHLAHHNFLFSADSKAEFGDIYDRGVPARDPTLYVAAPSRSGDEAQAPSGCEALYVLVHVPYLRAGQRWEGKGGLMEGYRGVIVEKMKRMGMGDLEERIVVERHLTPNGIEGMYNAEGGAIYGLASHGRMLGGFKPRNRSRVLKGLYLAGGSVNPGPGVPMVLMSGVTAAQCVAEDHGLRDGPAVRVPAGAGGAAVEAGMATGAR